MNINDLKERFNNWLVNRCLTKEEAVLDSIFDGENFVSSNGVTTLSDPPLYRYGIWFNYNPPQSVFPPDAVTPIDLYLEKLKSLEVNKREIKNEYGIPLIKYIREEGRGDFEPVWSFTKTQNPAELLLPTSEKLLVENINNSSFEPIFTNIPNHSINFKNNLFCVYGKYVLYATDSIVEIKRIDQITSNRIKRLETHTIIVDEWNITKSEDDQTTSAKQPFTVPLAAHNTINFMKISKFFDRDVIVICTDGAIVLVYDLEYIDAKIRNKTNTSFRKPLAVFRTRSSCWSADIYCKNKIAMIAVGHNGPGVSLFVYKKNKTNHTISCELPSKHNVPCVNFIPNHLDSTDDDFITLSYASIYGNITTVRINTNHFPEKTIIVELLDIQFLGDSCWSVTPMNKRDFLKVSEFELLNLNFQEMFKKSIIYSAILDSSILGFQPPSLYHSGNFGIGTLTTQIPVPVADLSLRLRNSVRTNRSLQYDIVRLRFTSFDKDGIMIKGITKEEQDNNSTMPLNRRPELSKDRIAKLLPDRDAYYYQCHSVPQRVSDSTLRKYNQWYEAKHDIQNALPKDDIVAEPFAFASYLKSRQANERDISHRHNITHKPKPHQHVSPIHLPAKNVILGERTAFGDGKFKSWLDLCCIDEEPIEEHDPFRDEPIISADDYTAQKQWTIHNHAKNVEKLLSSASESPSRSSTGFNLKNNTDDFLFVTTSNRAYLMKPDPLIVTSFTEEEIFPLENASFCEAGDFVRALNRINMVCHIKELNCIVIASQIGLVSLLRLTEYKGIFSFRQEYIIGWNDQDNEDPRHDHLCILSSLGDDDVFNYRCDIDDVGFPYFNITGLDYTYVPRDNSNGILEHAILYIVSGSRFHRYKIMAGSEVYRI